METAIQLLLERIQESRKTNFSRVKDFLINLLRGIRASLPVQYQEPKIRFRKS